MNMIRDGLADNGCWQDWNDRDQVASSDLAVFNHFPITFKNAPPIEVHTHHAQFPVIIGTSRVYMLCLRASVSYTYNTKFSLLHCSSCLSAWWRNKRWLVDICLAMQHSFLSRCLPVSITNWFLFKNHCHCYLLLVIPWVISSVASIWLRSCGIIAEVNPNIVIIAGIFCN